MTSRADEVRRAVVEAAIVEDLACLESAGSYLGDYLAWDHDYTDKGAGARVLRALVETLRLTWEMVEHLEGIAASFDADGFGLVADNEIRPSLRALADLLTAAGVPRDTEER